MVLLPIENPHPTKPPITDQLEGDICRRGTYAGIRRAVAPATEWRTPQ